MKKNNSKKLILAAIMFFNGSLVLSIGNQEMVNAAQEVQEGIELKSLEEEDNENLEEENKEKEEEKIEEEKIEEEKEELQDACDDCEDGMEENDTGNGDEDKDIENEEGIEENRSTEEGSIEEDKNTKEEEGGIEEDENIEEGKESIEKNENTEEGKENIEKNENTEEEEDSIEKNENTEEGKESVEKNENIENGEGGVEEDENFEEEKEYGKNELEENKELLFEENKLEIEEKNKVEENEIDSTLNESDTLNLNENSINSEKSEDYLIPSHDVPEKVIVQQITIESENQNTSSVIKSESKIETEWSLSKEDQMKEPEITEMDSQGIVDLVKERLPIETYPLVKPLQDVNAPILTIEELVSSSEEKEIHFHYYMDDEDLREYQMKVFHIFGGKEELIWEDNQKTEGELCFEKEGNYLVYLYAKDGSGNESRTYQSFSLGSFEMELEELNQLEHKEVELTEMEELLEGVFEGSNVATYQFYINGEQYQGNVSEIPEGKCILTVEMEDTNGNYGQKTMEIITTNKKMKEQVIEEQDKQKEESKKEMKMNQISGKENEIKGKNEGIGTEKKKENEKRNSGIPFGAAGFIGSLMSGLLILSRRIKH